jgi:DNA (cytosine-5)-methyltransferase 1
LTRYLSLFSGIECATIAWKPLGWKLAAYAEIDPFASAVTAFHNPGVPNLGDVTKADFDATGPVDVIVGGSPCQSFSSAGRRLGMDDPRGNLALEFGRVVYRKRPAWFVFENVPGMFSSDGGWDFGTLLAAFAGHPAGSVLEPPECGWRSFGVVEQANSQSYGLAWRVLDCQYFGLAQRRKRVFVVGCLGDWRGACAVLSQRESLSGHPAPRGEAGARTAGALGTGASIGGGWRVGADEAAAGQIVAHTLRADRFDASEDGTGRGTPLVPIAYGGNDTRGPIDVHTALSACHTASGRQDFESETFLVFDPNQITSWANRSNPQTGDPCHTLPASSLPPHIAFDARQSDVCIYGDTAGSLDCQQPVQGVTTRYGVRRITPIEAERLQGIPGGYTDIIYRGKPAADGNRYKAIGNSFPPPVLHWIGKRIDMVSSIMAAAKERAA